jgi:hypothetical protein
MADLAPIDLKFFYSGGSSNSDPALSIGGAISSVEVPSGLSYVESGGGIAGVTLVGFWLKSFSASSKLEFDADAGTFRFAHNTVSFGVVVSKPTVDGILNVGGSASGGNGGVDLSVVVASLPTTGIHEILLANDHNKQTVLRHNFALDSVNGHTDYVCLYAKNTHATESFFFCNIYRRAEGPGADFITSGIDPIGINAAPPIVATPETAPVGVTFAINGSAPTAPNLGALAPGDFAAFWIRRVLNANNIAFNSANFSAFAAYVSTPV